MNAAIPDAFTWLGGTGSLHACEVGIDGDHEVSIHSKERVTLASVFKIFALVASVRAVDGVRLHQSGLIGRPGSPVDASIGVTGRPAGEHLRSLSS